MPLIPSPGARRAILLAVGSALAALAAGSVAVVAIGSRRLGARIEAERGALLARAIPTGPTVVTEADLGPLPAPVARWLRAAGVVGRPRASTVQLHQTGEIRLAADRDWWPYRADQWFSADPPGFVWAATVRVAPLVVISGRDRLADGHGAMSWRALGAFPVAETAPGPELDQGTALRYLGEICWFPSAALGPWVAWEVIDDRSARARLTAGSTVVSGVFRFGDDDLPVESLARRYGDFPGGYREEPWSTRVEETGVRGGVRMPVAGDVTWQLAEGDFTYIRWRVDDVAEDAG